MGMDQAQKLKSNGVSAKKGSHVLVDVRDITIPKTGPLAHPRWMRPLDADMLADVKENGVSEAVVVRRDGVTDGKELLTLIDGSRRVLHLLGAIEQLIAEGAIKDDHYFLKVEFFSGDDKAALLYRLACNTDPLKVPDSPSVLAATALQLKKAKATDAEILAVMPRAVDLAILTAMYRWPDLTPDAVIAFDGGAPLALLESTLDAPRDEQASRLAHLVSAGATHKRGATRILNAQAKQAAANATASAGKAPESAPESNGKPASTPAAQKPGTPPANATVPTSRPHPKTMGKVQAGVAKLPAGDPFEAGTAHGFELALRYALGENVEGDLPAHILAVIINVHDGVKIAPAGGEKA